MAASTQTSAGALTADQVQRILVKPLEAASVFLAAGPRIFDVTADGPVRIPKLVNMTTPAWHGENELITEVDATFGEVVLLNGTKSLKSITRFSNELARSSVVALDSALRDKMVLDVASKIDEAFINGSGATGIPLGLLNYTGVQSITAVGVLTLDKLLDAVALTYTANVDTSRLRWMMPSRTFIALRKIKDTAGQYCSSPTSPPTSPSGCSASRSWSPTGFLPTAAPARTRLGRAGRLLADCRRPRPRAERQAARPDLRRLRPAGDPVVARYDAAPLNPSAIVVLRGVTS
jgi:HK97 family phage major capsid protein